MTTCSVTAGGISCELKVLRMAIASTITHRLNRGNQERARPLHDRHQKPGHQLQKKEKKKNMTVIRPGWEYIEVDKEQQYSQTGGEQQIMTRKCEYTGGEGAFQHNIFEFRC